VSRGLRLAHVGPLPPAPSGIADYAAELLPYLAVRPEVAALDLYQPPGLPAPLPVPAAPQPGSPALAVCPWSELPARLAAGEHDLVVYQLGNHPHFHGAVYRTLLEHPGVVVLHEYVLHHMVRELTLAAGDADGYVEELRYAYGSTGRALGRRAVATGVPVDPYAYPLFERAVDAALGVLVHNESCARRVRASRPDLRLAVVAQHLSLEESGQETAAGDEAASPRSLTAAARGRLGLPAEDFLVGVFGYQNRSKRLDSVLAAFARLVRRVPRARLAVVGGVDPKIGLDGMLAALGDAAAAVQVVGRVEEKARFLDWMRAVDAAVNLRWPTAGETSAAMIRLLGLGKPLIVTAAGSFAEIPRGCAVAVPPQAGEVERVAAVLVALAEDPDLARDLGANARIHMARHHTPERAAAGYASFLASVAADAPAAGPRRPAVTAVPPLAPWDENDLAIGLAASVAACAADLGVEATESELLEPVAAALVDLGLDGSGHGVRRAARAGLEGRR